MSDDILKEAEAIYDAIMGESDPDRSNTLCYMLVALTPKVIAEARKWQDAVVEERAGNIFDKNIRAMYKTSLPECREKAARELGVEI